MPTFPNARHLFARQEWEPWRVAELRAEYTTDPYYEDSLLPVMDSGQAELVAMDFAFDDSVWIEPWPGHTPGHVCIVVRSQSDPCHAYSGSLPDSDCRLDTIARRIISVPFRRTVKQLLWAP